MRYQHHCYGDCFFSYSEFLQTVSCNTKIREDLKKYRPFEAMRFGYESMADINLDICEDALIDCVIDLSIYEDNLNGDDTKSEH